MPLRTEKNGENGIDISAFIADFHQWEMAHIPVNIVHGTYNPFGETLRFLAILSPAKFEGPALVDVCEEEPWRSLKAPVKFE